MARGVTQLWKEWEIQILVLLSFSLQLILLVFAWIRRHKGSTLLRIFLWLAYLMADSTAIYTLGHLSLSSRSHEHQLVVFWAPFLLLHLGGPDTITAYAFEDNQLWLRHLLTLAVQVLGAAYVLYQSIASHGTLFFASILTFVTGFLKYGERTWALKCANLESIESSLDLSDDTARRKPYDGRVRRVELDAEEVLLGAHYMFNVCKSVFADSMMMSGPEREAIAQGIQFNGGKYMYELIEMQLSLMYDILYTKAAVIHTWYGSCIRAISPLATLTAFLLFELNSRDAYSAVDVAVTYVLLVGAFVLDITSLFRAIGSSWTCAFLHAQKWDRLHGAVLCLRRRFPAACSRRWLYSIGQYNLLDFCTRDMTELRSRITKKVGLEDWWNKFHYSSTTGISESIRDLVLEEIQRRLPGDLRNARGRWALNQRGLQDELDWSAHDTDFDQSILIWHVATDVYLCRRQQAGFQGVDQVQNAERLVKAIKQLSDYMMFLFVVYPYMLPGPVRNSRYSNNCDGLVTLWHECSTEEDSSSVLTPREKLAVLLYDRYGDKPSRNTSDNPSPARDTGGDNPSPARDTGGDNPSPVSRSSHISDNNPHGVAYIDGAGLAGTLLATPGALEMIAGVWIEMLCYAARHCSEVSHAKQLSSGGELVTALGLLVEYSGWYSDNRSDPSTNGAAAEASVYVDNISGVAGEICEEHDGAAAEISEEYGNTRLDGTDNA